MSNKQKNNDEKNIPYSRTKAARAIYRKTFYENNKKKVLDGQKDYLKRKKNGEPLKNEQKQKQEIKREKWRHDKQQERKRTIEQQKNDLLEQYNAKYGDPNDIPEIDNYKEDEA